MRTLLAVITLLVAHAAPALADDKAYTTDNNGNIFELNFTTGSKTLLGNTSAVTGTLIESMAYEPFSGVVYAINSSGQFFSIVPQSATATLVGSTGLGNMEAMDLFDGQLVAFDFSLTPSAYEINPFTGTATYISTSSIGFTSRARAVAFASPDLCYVADLGNLVSYDLVTGAATSIGPIGASVYAMDFVGGTLYAIDSSSGNYYSVDTGTGAGTFLGNFGAGWYLGLAAVEPEGDRAYANDTSGNIHRINFTSGTTTIVGNVGGVTGTIESMAHDGDNDLLYAINTGGQFFSIDTTTTTATPVGNTGLGNVEGMDMLNGRVLAYRFSSNTGVYEIDPLTGSPTLISNGATPISSVPRAAALESDDLALIADGSNLITYQNSTGIVASIGPTGGFVMYGMDFVNGTLYGVTSGGQTFLIDRSTGAPTALGSVGAFFFLSLAGIDGAGPVPTGELTASSDGWNRITDADFIPGPCGTASALDSYNDNQPFETHAITVIDPFLPVQITMTSLEPNDADFDPFLALYCDCFGPQSPLNNFLSADDDSGGYPTATMSVSLDPGETYVVVASSYASYAPARYGLYHLSIQNAVFSNPCPADLNGDTILDNGDIQAFLALFLGGDLVTDFNCDGILDNGDIQAFVALFLAGC